MTFLSQLRDVPARLRNQARQVPTHDIDEDEVEAARRLVQAKLRSVRYLDRDKAVRRLVGMLARKGHSSSVAFRVVKDELDLDLDPEMLEG